MKDEATANAETDKKEKERIDTINKADSMIFQTEKQLKEFGDKLPADKKAPIEAALQELKDAHKAQNIDAINTSIEKLNTVFQSASQEMYNAQGGQPGAADQGQAQQNPNAGANQNAGDTQGNKGTNDKDDVTDVDFEEVK